MSSTQVLLEKIAALRQRLAQGDAESLCFGVPLPHMNLGLPVTVKTYAPRIVVDLVRICPGGDIFIGEIGRAHV